MYIFRFLLFPLTLLYNGVTFLRRFLYKKRIISSVSFSIPTIVVGNLRVGGTGKTPHIEYLVRLFSTHNIAVLSRGYRRKSKGVLSARQLSEDKQTVNNLGDEPLQYATKFPNIEVVVAEKRKEGLQYIQDNHPEINLVLLDDAYQHLSVNYTCKILLTEYERLYIDDYPFPTGNLREGRSAASAADIIIVTKCPLTLSEKERDKITQKIKLKFHQKLFFTAVVYDSPLPINKQADSFTFDEDTAILLLTGIANPQPLIQYLSGKFKNVSPFIFPDHHVFTEKDLKIIEKKYKENLKNQVAIFTTEKDLMRLREKQESILSSLPIFAIPVEVVFLFDEGEQFNGIFRLKPYFSSINLTS